MIDDKKAPVKYGEPAFVGPSKDGDYPLSFTARYFQTGDKVTPGRANSRSTTSSVSARRRRKPDSKGME